MESSDAALKTDRGAGWTSEYIARLVSSLDRVGSLALDPKVAAARRAGTEPFSLKGSPVRPSPSHIKEAVIRALDEEGSRPSRGISELRTAIAELLARAYGASVDPDANVLVTNGAMHAVSVLCGALLEPGDRVVLPSPTFFYDGIIRLAGGEPVYVPCYEEEDWQWDLPRIAQAVSSNTKLLIACNPGNPTGYVPTKQDMEALVELADKHRFMIISDESYERLIYDGASFTSAAAFQDAWQNVVLVRSMSKSYAMSTWRVGYLVGNANILKACTKVFEYQCLYCNYVSQKAAVAAIQGPQDWLLDVVPEFQNNRDIAYNAVRQTELLSCVRPKSGAYLFVNVSHLGLDCEAVSDSLLFEAGIPTVVGRYFQGPGYLRLPFGGNAHTIRAMGESLGEWVRRSKAVHR